ncbi:hypothetical protein REJC140_02180 [Pseudorhizobium endolithicum]|uniref:Uncharacterized protein n=1 Tax=Pseudorhizobium endolithicum TaxID=1191678 RepID=A0ABM8PY65_9HYPH|nr:hypothetical protein [Pseudorhizobium endolithicum]CAD7054540.1 hypothetical protein REJC140_02180 [Pseudorhizobium endolithicum]
MTDETSDKDGSDRERTELAGAVGAGKPPGTVGRGGAGLGNASRETSTGKTGGSDRPKPDDAPAY